MPLYLNRKKRVDCVMDIKHFRVDRRGRGVWFRNWGGGGWRREVDVEVQLKFSLPDLKITKNPWPCLTPDS